MTDTQLLRLQEISKAFHSGNYIKKKRKNTYVKKVVPDWLIEKQKEIKKSIKSLKL